jgi:hypothetical protein
MRQPGRDVWRFSEGWIVVGVLALLGVVTALAAARQTQQSTPPPLASFSNAPEGAHALKLWLQALGESVRDDSPDPFTVPAAAKLALMLEPSSDITPAEWHTLDAWVEGGGTLVLAGDGLGTVLAAAHYTVTLSYPGGPPARLGAQLPLFASPPLDRPVPAQAQAYLSDLPPEAAPLLATDAGPVAITFARGQGRVIISAAPYAFTNAGLKEAGNPELVLNLVSAAPRGLVWFDEWHHGVRPSSADAASIVGPEEWLRATPAGHALLLVAAILFLALLLRGLPFGRPVPLAKDIARRAPLEYITAMANLHRRAGQRRAALRHYHDQLKRQLGRRYRLDPALPDPDYVTRLAGLRPNLDAEALRALLAALAQPGVSEAALVRLAGQAADWMKEPS